MKNIIDSDFSEILDDGLAGTLLFTIREVVNEALGITMNFTAKVSATIEETTETSEFLIGGGRAKRSFSATLRRSDLRYNRAPGSASLPIWRPFLPKINDLITYNGTEYRIRLVSTDENLPLVRIEFSEK